MQTDKTETGYDAELDRPLFGAKAIADAGQLPGGERQAYYMAARGYIDVTHVGRLLTSTKRRVFRSLGISA